MRVWSGAEPEGTERVTVGGRDATLIVWSPDYDGKGKAWVRFDDGDATRSSAARASSAADGSLATPVQPRDGVAHLSRTLDAAIVTRRHGADTGLSGRDSRLPRVRLLVARCEVRYSGRLNAVLPEAVRLLILKADGSVLVHDDAGGFKPLNWMTAPTSVEDEGDTLVVRKPKTEDALEIRLVEVLSDVVHDMGESAALQKDGVERDLQDELAAAPTALGEELTLVKREWATEVGPVDLMCRDEAGEWVAVEIKRIGTIEAVEQLTRYLGFIREDPAKAAAAGSSPRRS